MVPPTATALYWAPVPSPVLRSAPALIWMQRGSPELLMFQFSSCSFTLVSGSRGGSGGGAVEPLLRELRVAPDKVEAFRRELAAALKEARREDRAGPLRSRVERLNTEIGHMGDIHTGGSG